ncbi:hypothetical protein [Nocardia huaxiensis]|uniref:Lipoprotein n=1 Tax=Nocardia huaxiensis TaxID=2755382 RepID=A0A7D6ZQR4_9NOCA|nr:hypothetical protein [Nocardia huaxiensis]QLY33023.1 hypothetical protein H0264_12990 [Nocardia huaxiensis]UFS93214.1 hypothetical protein LPY97_20370 [Nocardia huaxiensis]
MIAPGLRLAGTRRLTSILLAAGCAALLPGCAQQRPADEPGTETTDAAARRSAFLTACTGTAVGWEATAVVSNLDQVDHRYLVVISFLTPESTLLERTTTEVRVGAGATQGFVTETRLDPVNRPQTVQCELRGVQQL